MGFGFRDWVRNLLWREASDDSLAKRAKFDVSSMTVDEIRKLVLQLWQEDPEDPFYQEKLELLGARAVPALLEQLRDERLRSAAFTNEDDATLITDSPFARTCEALRATAPRAAVPLLIPFSELEAEHFRGEAALLLAAVGSDECAAPVARSLADRDESVREFALLGIEYSLEAERATPAFRRELFPALTAFLDDHSPGASEKPPELLLRLERELAVPILLSARHLSPDNHSLEAILSTCNRSGVEIAHSKLLPLLAALAPLSDAYPHDRAFAAALTAYARNPDPDAERYLRRQLTAPVRIATAAAEGLLRLAGVEPPVDYARTRAKALGVRVLNAAQQRALAVFSYDAEVRNGGHTQYLVNSTGDDWQLSLAGLDAIGAQQRATILREACELFPDNCPPTDCKARRRLVARFRKRETAKLDALDKRYYKQEGEPLELLIALYALDHPDQFSAA